MTRLNSPEPWLSVSTAAIVRQRHVNNPPLVWRHRLERPRATARPEPRPQPSAPELATARRGSPGSCRSPRGTEPSLRSSPGEASAAGAASREETSSILEKDFLILTANLDFQTALRPDTHRPQHLDSPSFSSSPNGLLGGLRHISLRSLVSPLGPVERLRKRHQDEPSDVTAWDMSTASGSTFAETRRRRILDIGRSLLESAGDEARPAARPDNRLPAATRWATRLVAHWRR